MPKVHAWGPEWTTIMHTFTYTQATTHDEYIQETLPCAFLFKADNNKLSGIVNVLTLKEQWKAFIKGYNGTDKAKCNSDGCWSKEHEAEAANSCEESCGTPDVGHLWLCQFQNCPG